MEMAKEYSKIRSGSGFGIEDANSGRKLVWAKTEQEADQMIKDLQKLGEKRFFANRWYEY